MVWVKYSDDFMLDERVQVIDCCADSALRAAYEVCNRTETDGVFYIGQLMTRWSPAKGKPRRLRKAIADLIEIGLVRRVEHDEALRRYTMAVEKGHQFGLRPAKNRHYFEIIDYLESQPSADEKQAKREKNRQQVAEHRQRKKDAAVRDLRKKTPDPDPGPVREDNDHDPMASKKREPTNAKPSTPSNGAADRDPASWLRREWEARQQKQSKPRKWQPEFQPHVDSIVVQASEVKGDTYAIMEAALDALFADPEQQKHGCIPKGLDWYWDRLAGPYLQKVEAAESQRKAEAAELRYQEAKQQAEEQHAREVAERARQKNGSKDGRGGTPVALAELMRSIDLKVD